MRDVFVLGIGQTRFFADPSISCVDLGATAALEAVTDAGINAKQVQVAYCSSMLGPITSGQMALERLGICDLPIINVTNACASGNTAVHLAYKDVAAGFCDVALAVGFESMTQNQKNKGSKGLLATKEDLGGLLGLTMPSFFSMVCYRLKELRGATMEDLCIPTIKNHYNAQFNPRAQYNKPLTYEQVMASPRIAGDLTTLQCCPQSDGGAAVILCSEEFFEKHNPKGHPKIRVAASVLHSAGWLSTDKDLVFSHVMRATGDEAYKMAGFGPDRLDLVELHDAFSGEEMAAYEPLRLCPDGECVNYARKGYFNLDGKLPVNPSGGLLSLGHPLGASGVRVNCEVVRQIRGEAGGYQVKGAKTGLAQMLGGVLLGGLEAAAVCGIQILELVES